MIPGDFQLPRRPDKKKLVLFAVMGGVSLAGLAGTALVITFIISAWLGRPAVFGFDEGPEQPIAFPHTVHAGTDILLDAEGNPRLDGQGQPIHGLGLDCTFCHRNVATGAAATIPAVGLCMTCHKILGEGIVEVEKLRNIFDQGLPIDWVRVHRLPDHVQFIHEAHIARFSGMKTIVDRITDTQTHIKLGDARKIDPDAEAGDTLDIAVSDTCNICHGTVSSMTRVRQVRSLKMGDCVDCHRDNGAPTDCTTCHY